MRKIFLFLLILLSFSSCNKSVETVNVVSSSYIVMEQSSNKILQGYNYNESRSVASISKIMTAIVVIENIDIKATVKVPKEINNVSGSSVYLKENEEVSVEKLLYALLLRSGNDAAITLALSVCKDESGFVELMNEKAQKLNLKNTYFSNPHGLDENDGGNISSAYDMAVLYAYCLENETFSNITKSKSYDTYINKNKLLKNYQYCTGGKTGYTKKAKRTLVTSASKNDINLVIVTLNCGDDFSTHQKIYESYFNNYQSIKVLSKGYNEFDNKDVFVDKDYYFITDLKDVNLLYHIDYNDLSIEITLYDNKRHVCDYMKVYFS